MNADGNLAFAALMMKGPLPGPRPVKPRPGTRTVKRPTPTAEALALAAEALAHSLFTQLIRGSAQIDPDRYPDLFPTPADRRAFLVIRYLSSRNQPITGEILTELLDREDLEALEVERRAAMENLPGLAAELHRCRADRLRAQPARRAGGAGKGRTASPPLAFIRPPRPLVP